MSFAYCEEIGAPAEYVETEAKSPAEPEQIDPRSTSRLRERLREKQDKLELLREQAIDDAKPIPIARAARLFGIGQAALARCIQDGSIPDAGTVRFDARVYHLVRPADVRAYLVEKLHGSVSRLSAKIADQSA